MKINLGPLVVILGCTLSALVSTGCGKSSVGAGHQGNPGGENSADRPVETKASAAGNASATVEEFAFPPDKEGKLLAEVLRPSEESLGALPAEAVKPRPSPASPSLKEPQLPLPPSLAEMPRPTSAGRAASAGRGVRPRLLPEEPPFSRQQLALALVEPVQFPVGPRIRWPSPDVNQPPPLPILGVPSSDRVSLDDPTLGVSLLAALSETISGRTTPAPFLRLVLPDPFEHRCVVRLRRPPEEIDLPFSVLPGPSKP